MTEIERQRRVHADNGVRAQEARERRAYLQCRVDNAKRIGRPAHIARCEARLTGFDARAGREQL